MTSVDERSIFAKLEAIKDIRSKTVQLEKLKLRILKEIENTDNEEKRLQEYRREMEMLLQEKMSHVEELRLIHADINGLENVIKDSEDNRSRAAQVRNRLREEYIPLKAEIDQMRHDYLGLERLPDLHEEEGSTVSPEYAKFEMFHRKESHSNPSLSFSRPTLSAHHPIVPEATVTSLPPSAPPGFLPPPPVGSMRLSKPPEIGSNRIQQPPSIGMAHPTFRSDFNVNLRQQPPPMKSCLSCHQQIHRNAPICPLCKAKSRSRNPKKPKKKDHMN